MSSLALLNVDGTVAVHPGFGASVTSDPGVLTSGGARRETRRAHETSARVFDLQFSLASGDEMDRLRSVITETRGGAGSLRWRAPGDAPGTRETAPRWRMLNASEASVFAVRRSIGGISATFSLHIEEIPDN